MKALLMHSISQPSYKEEEDLFLHDREENAHGLNYCKRANVPVLTSVCNYNKVAARKKGACLYLYKYETCKFDRERP